MSQPEKEQTLTVPCPHCGKAVAWQSNSRFRPFCSKRCKLIDLGAWADETHRIPGDPQTSPENAFDD